MESNLQQNFNVGFTNMKSDVLIHLTQWQYWWWFWFSLLWAFYYMVILKMVRFRSLKFRPRLATTLRPHGKWGDLIVCIIPVSWCANIITNSNFILRMIEWQSESGLLTVRIRGKQWYWVYKFELKTFTDIFTIPKNIGHNKWQISTPGDLQVADDYLHVMQLRSQNRWAKSYWEELSKEISKSKNFHMISPALSIPLEEEEKKPFDVRTIDDVEYIFHKSTLNKRLSGFFAYTNLSGISVEELIEKIKNSENEFSDTTLSSDEIIDTDKIDVVHASSEIDTSKTTTNIVDSDAILNSNTDIVSNTVNEIEDSINTTDKSVSDNIESQVNLTSGVEIHENKEIVEEQNESVENAVDNVSSESHNSVESNLDSKITETSEGDNHDDKLVKNSDQPKSEPVENAEVVEEEKFKFSWTIQNKQEFNDILVKNKISKSDFRKLVYDLKASPDNRFDNLDEFFNHFTFDENNVLDTSSFDIEDFKNFLNILVHNTRYLTDILDLLLDLNKFFEEKVFQIIKEKNPEYVDFFSSNDDFRQKLSEWLEYLKDLNRPSNVLINHFDSLDKESDFANFNNLFEDRSNLSFDHYTNFLVRLFNKKMSWDESQLSDTLDDSMKEFLSNDEVFLNRSNFIESLNSYDFEGVSKKTTPSYSYGDFNEFDRNSRKSQGTTSPVRLIKFPISNKSNFDLSSDVIEMFRFRFNENESATEHRLTPNSAFLIIRQKRYKRRKVILPRNLFYKDIDGNTTKRVKSSNYTFLSQNSIILENDFNATKRYKFFKKNKMRDEMTNLVLSKRILRTRRTLVLPAHLNITAITNSFDVIHSWFIPGLGLKMDAIPGRATHHTFYIDNVGFYYGQCAEICGRYHHHMPIRICALPFEHFLLWWQSFGLPKLLFTKNFRRYSYSYGSRKYSW